MSGIYLYIKIIVIIVILIPRYIFIVSKDILKICNQISINLIMEIQRLKFLTYLKSCRLLYITLINIRFTLLMFETIF